MEPSFIIGIDLGTTNSVVAYKKNSEEEAEKIKFLDILQLTKAKHTEEKSVLPSFLYIPSEHELPKGSIELPWAKDLGYCIGEFARKQGAQTSGRLVSSAKSWLSHNAVDRHAKLLPFAAYEDVEKISPVEASMRYLLHLKNCWNHAFSKKQKIEKQQIYLTVPASFDAVARELTVQAAQEAGLNVTLLEEPQAAFYSWLYHNEKNWRELLKVGDLVLVVDVGGGTTDFSLVSVMQEEGNLILKREAVGDHILLGGDNMDLALAHVVSTKLPKANLDAWQSVSLWHSCREAKETMLADASIKNQTITILGRGSSIIGRSHKAKLTQEEVYEILSDGFFPKIDVKDHQDSGRRIGLAQLNLPYETEPAITKHIAKFLYQNGKEEEEFIAPTTILFNGGVFHAQKFKERIVEVVNGWLEKADKPLLKVLQNESLDLSVALGASYYGQAQYGKGIRIRSGTARSYYLGIETSMPAIPGMKPPLKALCVVPHGMEEGTETDVPVSQLGLTIGQPVEFPFFHSNTRKKDEAGLMLDQVGEELERCASLETTLTPSKGTKEGEVIPVQLHSKVTEIGTLEISCCSEDKKHQWQLELNIRETETN